MKQLAMICSVVILGGVSVIASGVTLIDDENKTIDLGGRVQVFGFIERVPDDYRNDLRPYLFLKQARLFTEGHVEETRFRMELAFAGEGEVKAPNPGVALNLLEASFDSPLTDSLRIKIGQFKVPYSRERLSYSGDLSFADRSVQNLAFQMGYDVGAALHGYPGPFAWSVAMFTGGGRDVPSRFLPQELGTPLFVFRAGVNRGVDQDIFTTRKRWYDSAETATAFYVDGLYIKDSAVGHSTVLNVKLSEKSLLINPNWNPFVNQMPRDQGTLWQVGTDFVYRAIVGRYRLATEAELNYGQYANDYGRIGIGGGRVQVGVYRAPVELQVRYASIIPDRDWSNGGVAITEKTAIQEITPAIVYYFKGDRTKLVLDLPLLIDVPVVTEPNIGAYVLTEQPDQAAILANGGSLSRDFVVQGRMSLQMSF